jgi:hypothetical protein
MHRNHHGQYGLIYLIYTKVYEYYNEFISWPIENISHTNECDSVVQLMRLLVHFRATVQVNYIETLTNDIRSINVRNYGLTNFNNAE